MNDAVCICLHTQQDLLLVEVLRSAVSLPALAQAVANRAACRGGEEGILHAGRTVAAGRAAAGGGRMGVALAGLRLMRAQARQHIIKGAAVVGGRA